MLKRSLLLLGLILLANPATALAYVDPVSGSLILQVLSAALLASLLTFKKVWLWFGNLMRSLRKRIRKA